MTCKYYINGLTLTKDEFLNYVKKQPLEESAKVLGITATPSAPFITDTNSYVKLGLKVALKEAVKQGATKIGWTTGEQQNERYDLSKQVDDIYTSKYGEEWVGNKYEKRKDVEITLKGGDVKKIVVDETGKVLSGDFVGEKLDNIVGKEMAEKIINAKEDTNFGEQDLKVGGKGMKGFYGSPTEGSLGIVGNVAKSLFKQEPNTVELQTTSTGIATQDKVLRLRDWVQKNKNEDYSYNDAQKDIENNSKLYQEYQKNIPTQHSIDITPELKAEVQKGLPLFQLREKAGPVTNDEIQSAKDRFYEALNNYIRDNETETEFIDAFDTVVNISKKEAEKLISETPLDMRDTFNEILNETPDTPDNTTIETPDTPDNTTIEAEDMIEELLSSGLQYHEGTEIIQDALITSENRGFSPSGGSREQFALIKTAQMIENTLRKYRQIMGAEFYGYIDKLLSDKLIPLWLKAGIMTRLQESIMAGVPIIPKAQVEHLDSKYRLGKGGYASEISNSLQLMREINALPNEEVQKLNEIFGKSGKLIQVTRDQLKQLVSEGYINEITANQLAEMADQIDSSKKRFDELESERKKLQLKLDKEKTKKKASLKRKAIQAASPDLILKLQDFIKNINNIQC